MPPKAAAAAASSSDRVDDAAVRRARRLGCGYDLALRVTDKDDCDVHLSLVYFNNVNSDYERELIKSEAERFLQETLPGVTTIDLVLGSSCYDRSVEVRGDIVEIQKKMEQFFAATYPNFSVNPNLSLHIDPRGLPLSIIRTKKLPLFGNWL